MLPPQANRGAALWRALLLLWAVTFLLCPGVRATLANESTASEFEKANALYEQSKFKEAGQAYESLAASGCSANVFYNLGNTEFRLGEPGKAILNYERTLALEPGHPEARANIAFARQETGAQTARATWLDAILLPVNSSWYIIGAAVAAWGLVFSWFFRSQDRPLLMLTAGFCALALGYAGCGIFAAEGARSLAIVITKQAEARLEPLDSAGVAETLPAGSQVKVIRERGPWTYCSLPDDALAWLPAGAIQKVRDTRS